MRKTQKSVCPADKVWYLCVYQSSRVFFGGGGLVTTLEGTFPFSSVFRSRIFSSCIFVIAKNWCWKKSGLVWVWVCLVLFCFVLSAWGFKKFFKKLVWFVSSFWNEPFPKNVCFQETSEKCWYLNRIFKKNQMKCCWLKNWIFKANPSSLSWTSELLLFFTVIPQLLEQLSLKAVMLSPLGRKINPSSIR